MSDHDPSARCDICSSPALTPAERRKVVLVGVWLAATSAVGIAYLFWALPGIYDQTIQSARQGRWRLFCGGCGGLTIIPAAAFGGLVVGVGGTMEGCKRRRGRFAGWILRESSEEEIKRRISEHRESLHRDPYARPLDRASGVHVSTRLGLAILLTPILLLAAYVVFVVVTQQ